MWLFHAAPWVCLQFVIVVVPDHTHLLFLTVLFLLLRNQLYILLSPYLYFIPFLYLDIFFLLEDDTLISKGSFMRTKQLFVLNHIRNKGEVGTIKLV